MHQVEPILGKQRILGEICPESTGRHDYEAPPGEGRRQTLISLTADPHRRQFMSIVDGLAAVMLSHDRRERIRT